jgi:hypothetical protein
MQPPPLVAQFIEWYCHEREVGETFQAWAEQAGVRKLTVQRWLQDDRVLALLEVKLRKLNGGVVKVQEVLETLHRLAVAGDVKAARTYLEAVDRMAPRRHEVTITDARNLSNEQLKAELQRAVALLERQPELPPVEDAEVVEDSLAS